MSDTLGYGAEPDDVAGLFQMLCGDLLDETDDLVLYTALTREQVLVQALVSYIRARRGELVAKMVKQQRDAATNAGEPITVIEARNRVATTTGLGTHQRVAQLSQAR
ncbi:hypothetical protein [Polymorphospora sp. NPDC050346]|uniref:hypothetical protein n=1 Tax=Polymorphospora sp. NPDC050346 TaxID=3155780 RepID=UPI0033D4C5A4